MSRDPAAEVLGLHKTMIYIRYVVGAPYRGQQRRNFGDSEE